MSLGTFFHTLAADIEGFFKGHQATIQTVIQEAQTAAGAATAVATILGEPPSVVAQIGKISDGLTKVGAAVTAATTAVDMTGHAQNLLTLTQGLISSGDIGVKSPVTQTAIGVAAQKVASVVGALETAAAIKSTPATVA